MLRPFSGQTEVIPISANLLIYNMANAADSKELSYWR